MDIAFLGTGLMGHPMARRLLEHGHRVAVYNRTAEKAADLVESGAAAAETPARAIADSEWVVMMLADAGAIEQALLDASVTSLLSGRRVMNMGTIAPHEARELAGRVQAAGGEFMECPVLGSIPEAGAGTLILMFGGTEQQFDAAMPLLRALGPKPLHIGPVGHASALKLAMNQLIAGLTTAFSLSLGLIRSEGVEVDKFMTVVRDSALYAPTYDKKLGRMLAGDFANPNFPLRHMLKDVRLLLDTAARDGLDVQVLQAVESMLEQGDRSGLGDQDYSALYSLVAPHSTEN
ncbi:MAG TPA: NAD(P)-dependent oxidoreductase [Gammaproteobacteria bacterium]|nr:NAD(P)-dependent oxidoreductase [Gammaproteobacteria bacterium]